MTMHNVALAILAAGRTFTEANGSVWTGKVSTLPPIVPQNCAQRVRTMRKSEQYPSKF